MRITNEEDYQRACTEYELLKDEECTQRKRDLANAIFEYEEQLWNSDTTTKANKRRWI